jgi:hypothetical protein
MSKLIEEYEEKREEEKNKLEQVENTFGDYPDVKNLNPAVKVLPYQKWINIDQLNNA